MIVEFPNYSMGSGLFIVPTGSSQYTPKIAKLATLNSYYQTPNFVSFITRLSVNIHFVNNLLPFRINLSDGLSDIYSEIINNFIFISTKFKTMASNSETGHAKNVANLESLISVIKGFGAVYNPSRQSIILTALISLLTIVKGAMSLVNSSLGSNSKAIAAREVAFKPLSSLATRILNALRSSETTQQINDSAQSLVRKLQGRRATPKLTEAEKAALLAEGKEKKEISSSQMDFDSRLDNFDKLIQLLIVIPQYAPNEVDLQLSTLTNYYNTLKALNDEARETGTQLDNARLNRNEIFDKDDSGLVDTAMAAKNYIKSLFGATSPQYKQVSGLLFKKTKY